MQELSGREQYANIGYFKFHFWRRSFEQPRNYCSFAALLLCGSLVSSVTITSFDSIFHSPAGVGGAVELGQY